MSFATLLRNVVALFLYLIVFKGREITFFKCLSSVRNSQCYVGYLVKDEDISTVCFLKAK